MSEGESLPRWDISVRVLVRSTRVGRPSSEERRRMERWVWDEGLEGEGEGEMSPLRKEGVCGERIWRVGRRRPK